MASITQTPELPGERDGSMWDSFKNGLRKSGVPWLFIAPSILVMLFISFVPQIYQVTIAFQDFGLANLRPENPAAFVGLDNFRRVLIDGLNVENYNFFPLLGFNFAWTIVNVFFHVVIGLAIALALNAEHVVGRRIYRALFVLPWALPGYITALVWNNLWQQNDGGVNLLLESVNERLGTSFATNTNWLGELNYRPIDIRSIVPWLVVIVCALIAVLIARRIMKLGLTSGTGQLDLARMVFGIGGIIILGAAAIFTALDIVNGGLATNKVVSMFDRAGAPTLAFYAVLIANIWLGWPFMMTVATGALQSIPPDLYEAADVDGATKWQQMTNITLPLLRPAMVPAIMLGTIWTFNQFNVIFFITAGGPRGQTDLLITQAYKLIQQEQQYGAAAAFSIVVFFILLAITLVQNRITRATKSFDEA
ncbi:MAG: sugar ABC transporter permease [Chloroflexota bacterium]|nr:sugar ABC transporter permease [Chloroflexota bacterium]